MVVVTSRSSYELVRGSPAELRRAVRGLRDQLAEHIVEAEGPDGLYARLAADAPRLTGPVAVLVADHEELLARADALTRRLDHPAGDVVAARRDASEFVDALSRHRQRGADLVYEAYQTDLGGET
jgi:hypothetical protein